MARENFPRSRLPDQTAYTRVIPSREDGEAPPSRIGDYANTAAAMRLDRRDRKVTSGLCDLPGAWEVPRRAAPASG
jgi:hypothetical protein